MTRDSALLASRHFSGLGLAWHAVPCALRFPELDLVALDVGDNSVTVAEATLEHRQGQRVLDLTLDGALERPGTKGRIEPFFGEPLFGAVGYFERQVAVGQQLPQPLDLDLEDCADLLHA